MPDTDTIIITNPETISRDVTPPLSNEVAQMMGIGRASSADQTGVRCDEFEVCFVTKPAFLADGKLACLNIRQSPAGL